MLNAAGPLTTGFNYGPTNSFDWYYFNLSINEPSDPIVPWWIFTLGNPAGNNWNYLQGLGMINVGIMDSALIGQVPSTQHALMNESFTVMAVTPSGRTGIESSTAPASTMSSGQLVQMQGASINGQLSKFGNFQLVSENSQFNPPWHNGI